MDLSRIKKVYIIGIKGSGVVSVAQMLKLRGVEVLGSDTEEKFFTEEMLQKMKIPYFEKFSPENVPEDVDLIIYSTAYNENNNIELQEAKKRSIRALSYPEVLSEFFNQKYGLAVCGTHGKTTTSAMLASVLENCGVEPSAIIGSQVRSWNGSVLSGSGEYFVLEADEYQNKLALYEPKGVILTSLDFDHPDFFKDFKEYKKVFSDFVAKIPKAGFLIVWGDSTDTLEVANSATCDVLKYGFGEENDFRVIKSDLPTGGQNIFEIKWGEEHLGKFEIQLVGKHNSLNATAVVAVCHKLGLELEKVREALKKFQGTTRRFEYIGEKNGAILIDDYGHHPEEIKATLQGARELYPEKNIIAVFHPHTFTRTKALLSEFSQSFDDADQVIVLDIYGSAREAQGGVHSMELVDLINKFSRDKAEHLATIPEVVEYLKDKIGPEDVVITIGAGNVFEVARKLKQ